MARWGGVACVRHTVAVRVLCVVSFAHVLVIGDAVAVAVKEVIATVRCSVCVLVHGVVVPLTAVLRVCRSIAILVDQVVTPVRCSILVLVHGVVMSLTTVV